MTEPPITDTEKAVLDFYVMGFPRELDRIAMVRRETGLSEGAALMFVHNLIATQRALAYSPVIVKRLREREGARARARRRRVAV